MNTEFDSLVRLRKTDIKQAASVLTESFQQYPLLVQKYPDESQRNKAAYYFFLVIVGYGIRWVKFMPHLPDGRGRRVVSVGTFPDEIPENFAFRSSFRVIGFSLVRSRKTAKSRGICRGKASTDCPCGALVSGFGRGPSSISGKRLRR